MSASEERSLRPAAPSQEFWREARATFRLALPIAASQLAQISIGLIDSLMLGRLGVVPLGASSVANTFFSLALVFGIGLLTPVGVLTARAFGAGRDSECGEILRHGAAVALAYAAAVGLAFWAGARFLEHLGQPAEVAAAARPYLVIVGWSLVPTLLFQAFRQFSEAFSQAWPPLAILVGGVLLKAALNWGLIYGNFGFPEWGLTGAGWATLAARTGMVLALVAFVGRSARFRGRTPRRWRAGLRLGSAREMLRIGLPVGAQHLFEVGAFSAAVIMMGWLGAAALAAHQIAISCAICTYMVAVGLSFATSIRVGQAAGRGRFDQVRRIGFVGFTIGTAVMSGFGLFFFFAGGGLAAAFVRDAEVIALAALLLKAAAFLQCVDSLQVVSLGALRGITDVRIPTLTTFVVYWLVAVPASYVCAFVFGWGPLGVWVGLATGLGLSAGLMSWRFHRLTRPGAEPRSAAG